MKKIMSLFAVLLVFNPLLFAMSDAEADMLLSYSQRFHQQANDPAMSLVESAAFIVFLDSALMHFGASEGEHKLAFETLLRWHRSEQQALEAFVEQVMQSLEDQAKLAQATQKMLKNQDLSLSAKDDQTQVQRGMAVLAKYLPKFTSLEDDEAFSAHLTKRILALTLKKWLYFL